MYWLYSGAIEIVLTFNYFVRDLLLMIKLDNMTFSNILQPALIKPKPHRNIIMQYLLTIQVK